MEKQPASHGTTKPGLPLVRALERGITILRTFSAERPRLSLSELARAAELDKGTTRRLLQTLSAAGLVELDQLNGTFALSIGVLELASAVEAGRELREIAAPYLADVSARTGTAAFLWVHHCGMALGIERVRTTATDFDTVWFRVGASATLNAGGGPRVLLAYIDEASREYALSRPMQRRTAATISDPDQLRHDATKIRERGWELAVDDFVVGLAAVGLPIFDRENRFVGAMSITGITQHIIADGHIKHLELLKKAVVKLSERITK